MVDQQLRVDAEHAVKKFFVVVIPVFAQRTARDVAHGKKPCGFQLFPVSVSDVPKVREGGRFHKEDRDAQVENIAEDIRNGNTEYLNDFLNAIISDSIREGITDIFGKGAELDDSEGVQTARKAKELLDSLAEYKPLAKVEELEECNYNMIDNVLNNEKPKEEKEKQTGRISIKEKLAEKKAVIEQRDKAGKEVQEKITEKKSEREI